MKLAELAGYSGAPPVVQFRHDAWMAREEPFSPEAVKFIATELVKPDRDRSGSFSASGLGSCPRQQQFTFLGMPKLPESGRRMAVLLNGKFVHLRLQAAGLTEGWLAQAEVPIPANPLGLKGTMDGVIYEGSVLEAKSQNSYGFRGLNEPKFEHRFQVGTYLACTGRDKGVVLYENKDNQETKEFVVERDDELETEVILRATRLQDDTSEGKLRPMLNGCVERKGWVYDYCSYKDRCPLFQTMQQVEDHVTREKEETHV